MLRAEKIDPTDVIVLANIAQGYKLKEKFKKAIAYYEKIIEQEDEQAIKFAKVQIELLSNKSRSEK